MTREAIGAATALALACTVALAACGSTSPGRSKTGGAPASVLAAARCMRAHGVPNFPDPNKSGGTVNFSPGSSTVTIDGVTFSGPAFQAAEKICQPFGGGSGRPPVTEHQRRAQLDFARCMRRHGLAQWADPTFPAGGGIMGGGGPYPKNSPAVSHAAKICNQTVQRQAG